uniref:Putative Permeases of the major facilitator superfamily n=1 Tax=Magnetococcus massalia (strain MO-1) TaxID=451514 RepID=A0A1S7LLE9_MAGMO|nr:putative Permeases of the major facilitator superfamily [Candidatus Magnetococcus massalia]
MNTALRNYLVVTGGYWGFTLTDGAIRMLVVLHFHHLGYSPFEIASLFFFYEFFGIVTNLVGGYLASRFGLNRTMHAGMLMQVVALGLLAAPTSWLSVPYVMAAQALSGIAKDLNKMSAKAQVKSLVSDGQNGRLFKWVAILTGSKNALKGVGFFLGAVLLATLEFQGALIALASGLFIIFLITLWLLPTATGKLKSKPKFSQIFSHNRAINILSTARFFLFGARDIWFVVALPVYLQSVLEWGHMEVGTLLAVWVIGYGFVQGIAPRLLGTKTRDAAHPGPGKWAAPVWALLLALFPVAIIAAMQAQWQVEISLVGGLILFGAIFAINSALHSYLVLAYADHDKVAMNVGFYYMANAGGRLAGTVLSGLLYQWGGLEPCLWGSSLALMAAGIIALWLPDPTKTSQTSAAEAAG